ncbi:3-dehydroquinate synthase [bacterium]|nr:3-dehydroquinate synthase [bacterium]
MKIDLMDATYPVNFEVNQISVTIQELLSNNDQMIVVIDEAIYNSVASLYPIIQELPSNQLFFLPARKESKTVFILMKILSHLETLNFARSGTIIAIGGGVIGDICGLAASLWYRGCNLIHVPTTLLAAVDSCLGGKTAINFGKTINALGSYYHPNQIIICDQILRQLPDRELSSGMAEVIKYTIIGNPTLYRLISKNSLSTLRDDKLLGEIIKLSLSQKSDFVSGDIKENGKRLFLNLGHTIGHAIEINSIYDGKEQLRHGEGVALGLIAIAHISYRLQKLSEEGLQRIYKLLRLYQLPTSLTPSAKYDFNVDELIEKCTLAAFRDKKRTKSQLRLILPVGKGDVCEMYETSSRELIRHGVSSVIRPN